MTALQNRKARAIGWSAAVVALTLATTGGAWAQARKTPYYASISAGKARMRTGPGRNYPASWLYQRPFLPVKVVDVYKDWRKVEDPAGTQGWMQAQLLSETRTALVMGDLAEMRDQPRFEARVAWRVQPGVVGRISRCARGWCWLDVRGQTGFIEQSHLWGVDPGEELN